MKKWICKKSRRRIAELEAEKIELLERLSDCHGDTIRWKRSALEYHEMLEIANAFIEVLQEKLSKFDRPRGAGGRFIGKSQQNEESNV